MSKSIRHLLSDLYFGIFHGPKALRWLWWGAISLLTISTGAVGWTIWQLRVDSLSAAVNETRSIATLLADQLFHSIQAIDVGLVEMRTSITAIDTPLASSRAVESPDIQKTLVDFRNRLPQTFNIAIADSEGKIAVSTAGSPAPRINIGDRDYFEDARSRPDDPLLISMPLENRVNGNRVIIFARRLESSTGAFAGVIFASVGAQYFEDLYGSVRSLKSLLFTLLKSDGTILARYPKGQEFAGRRLSAEADRLKMWSDQDRAFTVLARTDGGFATRCPSVAYRNTAFSLVCR